MGIKPNVECSKIMALKVEEVKDEEAVKEPKAPAHDAVEKKPRAKRGAKKQEESVEAPAPVEEKPKRTRKPRKEETVAEEAKAEEVKEEKPKKRAPRSKKKSEDKATPETPVAEPINESVAVEEPKKESLASAVIKVAKKAVKEVAKAATPKHYQLIARYSGIELPTVTLDNLKCIIYECDATSHEEALAEFKRVMAEGNNFDKDEEIVALLTALFGKSVTVQEVSEGETVKYSVETQTL